MFKGTHLRHGGMCLVYAHLLQHAEFRSEDRAGREAGGAEGMGSKTCWNYHQSYQHKKPASLAHRLRRQYTGYKVRKIHFPYFWPDVSILWPEAGQPVPASLLVTPSWQAACAASSLPSYCLLVKPSRALLRTSL